MLDRVVGLISLVPFAIGTAIGPAVAESSVDLTFQDPAIIESSGLVVRDGLFLTTNDSGDGGRVFVVDGAGETVGSTTWTPEPRDVEALAPAGPGEVWVGDIGDNAEAREIVQVLRVPYGPEVQEADPTPYTLVYPDGPHDAETLLSHPRTGQLFVVSKSLLGGTLYAAPRELSTSAPNRLRAVSDSLAFATDGSFFPDGEHYVLRNYFTASVYTFPGHEEIGTFPLPRQQQGEGIAVDERDVVHISTEGQFSEVRSVVPPKRVRTAMDPPAASERRVVSGSGVISETDDGWPWLLGGAALAGFVAIGGWLLLRRGAAS